MSYQPKALPQSVNRSFAELPAPTHPRSTFGLGTKHTTTANASTLFPIYWEETLPADTHSVKLNLFGRLLTSIHPTMDNLHLDWHAFHIPNRLTWENWQKFMGERRNPGDSIDYTCPKICHDAGPWEFKRHGIGDYLDFPTTPVKFPGITDSPNLPNAFLHRAIWLIWNEWYRDQNTQDSFPVPLGDGPDDPTSVDVATGYSLDDLPPRNKRHSYLTAILPWPQKGDAVALPLGAQAPVVGNNKAINFVRGPSGMGGFGIGVNTAGTSIQTGILAGAVNVAAGSAFPGGTSSGSQVYVGLHQDPLYSGMIADLSLAEAVTINQWREAVALQQMLEQDARSGTRYVEIILAQFGVVVPDFRVQRPEFIGGGSTLINMSAVADTANDLGQLAGVATFGESAGFTYSAVEHGHIIVLASVRADLRFQNKLDRRVTRNTRYDFFRSEMSHLGEQEVRNREIFFTSATNPAADVINNDLLGYIPRFDEYRYREPMITGMMRSNDPTSLDTWHYGIKMEEVPVLNEDYMKDVSEDQIRRTVADAEGPLFRIDIDIQNNCTRILPVDSIPGLLRL